MEIFVSGFIRSAYCNFELVVRIDDKRWQELKINT